MSDTTTVSTSPQSPGEIVAEAQVASPAKVVRAADGARAAGRVWSRMPATSRSAALRNAAAALESRAADAEDLIVREVGKPRLEARGEVARGAAILHYYAQQALDPVGGTYPPVLGGLLYTERRPRGVAGLITPWNFPVAIPLWKAAPALACGNDVLLKPSGEAIGCAQLIAEILAQALPDGLFALLPGERETAQAVIESADVVSFTGSTHVGRQVAGAAAGRGVPVQAEMGGQNAAIILADADLEATAKTLVGAAMGFAGQKCTSTRRIITLGDPGELLKALESALAAAQPGDPADESTAVGPVINEPAQRKVRAAVDEASAHGAVRISAPAAPGRDGWYVTPTFVSGLPPGHRLLQEETFGPFAAVFPAADETEAVRLANGVGYGLVTSVHGNDLGAVLGIVAGLDTGMIKVNAPTAGVDFYLPFGGEKDSSIGPREQGKAAMDFYSSTRTVTFAAPSQS